MRCPLVGTSSPTILTASCVLCERFRMTSERHHTRTMYAAHIMQAKHAMHMLCKPTQHCECMCACTCAHAPTRIRRVRLHAANASLQVGVCTVHTHAYAYVHVRVGVCRAKCMPVHAHRCARVLGLRCMRRSVHVMCGMHGMCVVCTACVRSVAHTWCGRHAWRAHMAGAPCVGVWARGWMGVCDTQRTQAWASTCMHMHTCAHTCTCTRTEAAGQRRRGASTLCHPSGTC